MVRDGEILHLNGTIYSKSETSCNSSIISAVMVPSRTTPFFRSMILSLVSSNKRGSKDWQGGVTQPDGRNTGASMIARGKTQSQNSKTQKWYKWICCLSIPFSYALRESERHLPAPAPPGGGVSKHAEGAQANQISFTCRCHRCCQCGASILCAFSSFFAVFYQMNVISTAFLYIYIYIYIRISYIC